MDKMVGISEAEKAIGDVLIEEELFVDSIPIVLPMESNYVKWWQKLKALGKAAEKKGYVSDWPKFIINLCIKAFLDQDLSIYEVKFKDLQDLGLGDYDV